MGGKKCIIYQLMPNLQGFLERREQHLSRVAYQAVRNFIR